MTPKNDPIDPERETIINRVTKKGLADDYSMKDNAKDHSFIMQDLEEIRQLVSYNYHYLQEIKPKLKDFFESFYVVRKLFSNIQWFIIVLIGIFSLLNPNVKGIIDTSNLKKTISEEKELETLLNNLKILHNKEFDSATKDNGKK